MEGRAEAWGQKTPRRPQVTQQVSQVKGRTCVFFLNPKHCASHKPLLTRKRFPGPNQVVFNLGQFLPRGTPGNVVRHVWLSQPEGSTTGSHLADATTHRTAPNVHSTEAEKPRASYHPSRSWEPGTPALLGRTPSPGAVFWPPPAPRGRVETRAQSQLAQTPCTLRPLPSPDLSLVVVLEPPTEPRWSFGVLFNTV